MSSSTLVAAMTFDWNFFSGLIGAIIGGCFSLLATWITLRHQIKSIRLQETTRLRWTKRWDVIAETYSRLAETYLALRRMLNPQTLEQAKQEIEDAQKAWKSLNDHYFQNSLFLPKEFDARVRRIKDQYGPMINDLSRYSESLYSQGQQANGSYKFYVKYKHEHENSLVGGQAKEEFEQLKDNLRAYLDAGEPQ